mmetsp:Transcript_8193/g.23087  ORF Transcript_8193/g.23087 Transcript_8193/m.23087 type:complete len:473 (+) Transcript_8193:50-1468(+)
MLLVVAGWAEGAVEVAHAVAADGLPADRAGHPVPHEGRGAGVAERGVPARVELGVDLRVHADHAGPPARLRDVRALQQPGGRQAVRRLGRPGPHRRVLLERLHEEAAGDEERVPAPVGARAQLLHQRRRGVARGLQPARELVAELQPEVLRAGPPRGRGRRLVEVEQALDVHFRRLHRRAPEEDLEGDHPEGEDVRRLRAGASEQERRVHVLRVAHYRVGQRVGALVVHPAHPAAAAEFCHSTHVVVPLEQQHRGAPHVAVREPLLVQRAEAACDPQQQLEPIRGIRRLRAQELPEGPLARPWEDEREAGEADGRGVHQVLVARQDAVGPELAQEAPRGILRAALCREFHGHRPLRTPCGAARHVAPGDRAEAALDAGVAAPICHHGLQLLGRHDLERQALPDHVERVPVALHRCIQALVLLLQVAQSELQAPQLNCLHHAEAAEDGLHHRWSSAGGEGLSATTRSLNPEDT